MRPIHPDEAALLRSVLDELPERQQGDLLRHVTRCRPCRKEHEATKRLHERLSRVGDSLAFAADDPFERRPAWREVNAAGRPAARTMAAALGRLVSEKQRITFALGADASVAAKALDLDDGACRLAAAHVLEEAVTADPSRRFADFAAGIAARDVAGGEAEAVLPGAQLGALAHLVFGNWLLFIGRKEAGASEFSEAWAALGEFDASEHLCAWVEVGESLRRSYEGRPVEGRLIAERALETFERYGLGRGVLRARHARAVGLYTVSEFREAHREFRAVLRSKDATGLDRARAVSGAAFCLAARGRFHEAAKEYSPVRRKLKGEGAMAEQYLLQGEMKAALGTAGRWHSRGDGLAAFALPEAGGAFHAREIAAKIVRAVSEEGLGKAKEMLGKTDEDPSLGYAYLFACQLAHAKVPSDPPVFVQFARAISEAARVLSYPKGESPAQPVCREQVVGDARLVESSALTFTGLVLEAIEAARQARLSFSAAGEDGFALALADFFEASSAIFAGRLTTAHKLLRSLSLKFRLYGQEQWQGRVQATVGLLALYRGRYSSALLSYDEALRTLEPGRDGPAYLGTLTNRAHALAWLGRFGEAKGAYARALLYARRLRLNLALVIIRNGLAWIDLISGNVIRALGSFERIAHDAGRMGFEEQVLGSQLRVAECLSRLGRSDDVLVRIKEIRRSPYAVSLLEDEIFRELLECVEMPSAAQIAHIADYLEGRNWDVRSPYKPFRLVRKGS